MLPTNDIYKIFSLPRSFFVDKNILKNKYYKLSKKYHPDLLKTDTGKIKEVNSAYKVLQDDYLRAKYLYKDPLDTKMNQEFLIEVLDLEERIDDSNSQDELRKIKDILDQKIDECKKNYKDPVYLGKWGYYRRLSGAVNKLLI